MHRNLVHSCVTFRLLLEEVDMSVMTYCKRDFEGLKKGELLLAGLLEDFMEEVAFEMRLKEWQHLMRNCWGKGTGDGEKDQCIGNRNRELCSEESDSMVGFSNISKPWLHIRITWGNFSSNIVMLGPTSDQINWNVL